MSVIGIVAALAAEARTLAPPRWRNTPASLDDTLLKVSGIGAVAAACAARALVAEGAQALLSWGMAGGLDPALPAGTLFLPSHVISVDGITLATTSAWQARLSAALAAQAPVTCGKLLASSSLITAVADKAAVRRQTGALAVDMESLAVGQIAAEHGLPFVAVRVIVDTAEDEVPSAVVAASRSGQIQIWRLLGALLLAPAELPAIVRLAQRYHTARRSLVVAARAGAHAHLAFPAANRS